MKLASTAFRDNEELPWRYAAPGQNELPPLIFEDVPTAARSLVIVLESRDSPVGTLTHWLAWNIPPAVERIDAVVQPSEMVKGMDAFGKIGYTGPAPPEGIQRYRFLLRALDCRLDLPAGSNREQLEHAVDGHELARSELNVRVRRPESKADS